MTRVWFVLSMTVLLAGAAPTFAREKGVCGTAACPGGEVIDAVRSAVAARCDCAATPSARAYMQCVKEVVGAAVGDGTLPKRCKGVVRQCEGALKCGHGVRPFRSVQEGVFQQSCALPSCHSTIAREGGLVLEAEDIAYASLVGQPSTHPEAGGMLRVKPGDPKNSFLIHKLRGTAPGEAMPQAAAPLSKRTIKTIEKWIKRGALSTSEECPPADQPTNGKRRKCNDRPLYSGNYRWKPLPPLEAPPPPTGIQLYVPPRDVEPGNEWETCIAFKPDWPGIAAQLGYAPGRLPVIRQQTYRMHEGSHHLLLYAYLGENPEGWAQGYFPCLAANCVNPGDCPADTGDTLLPVGGTQVAGTRYEVRYPAGVGIPVLGPDVVLIANLHYTNPFQPPQPIYGEAWLNLEFYAPNEYRALLDGVFAINYQDLIVEPFTTRTISRVWQPQSIITRLPTPAAVFQLFGHMHKRGDTFQIDYVRGGACSVSGRPCGRDDDCACRSWQNNCTPGQTCVRAAGAEDTPVYFTDEWDHAPVRDFPPPYFLVNSNEGLRWSCRLTNGVADDPTRPPKLCHEGCDACGWTGGRCSVNNQLCKVGSACAPDETCEAETSGLSSSGFRCRNTEGRFTGPTCCPGSCTPSADARTCYFTRGRELRYEAEVRTFQENEPMPLVFGNLADDDMCNMFGYFIKQADLPLLD
jgi:hypothetical protein